VRGAGRTGGPGPPGGALVPAGSTWPALPPLLAHRRLVPVGHHRHGGLPLRAGLSPCVHRPRGTEVPTTNTVQFVVGTSVPVVGPFDPSIESYFPVLYL